MKNALIMAIGLLSLSAFGAVELTGKMDLMDCTIKNNQVLRVQKFGKGGPLSLTQKFEISTTGLEEILKVAEAAVTDRPSNSEFRFTASVDDRKFNLNVDDSKAAMAVIQMIVKACQFN